ncbi:hypothetical protein [Cetobacterium sp.]|uniref:hypothetical protein n=1 Tax=Cetobacterium sp. TaxID=2071632 RepID=UPI003EE5782F
MINKLLCLVGLHDWKEYFTGHRTDTITYLECKRCKKRSWKDLIAVRYVRPLDKKWLRHETAIPKHPEKPKEK